MKIKEKEKVKSNLEAKIIVNGNCCVCNKPLDGDRIFLCKECEEKNNDYKKV